MGRTIELWTATMAAERARRTFWPGILDCNYAVYPLFRQVRFAFYERQPEQMLAWLALALPPLALLGSEQPAAEAGNASALVGATLLGIVVFGPVLSTGSTIVPFFGLYFGPQL